MTRLLRIMIALSFAVAMLWPEWPRWQAEHDLAGLGRQLDDVLTGRVRGDAALAQVRSVQVNATKAHNVSPNDPRAVLYVGVSSLLLGDTDQARQALESALIHGERPEHLLNYGRVCSALGDEVSARQAFRRVLWAAPAAASSLPASLRAELQRDLDEFESELRDGRAEAPLPLPASLPHR
ncbi:MAG: hypothetical protein IPK97_08740 [Ahniella sp.]|nr:hypothetical protein [Ahniella sp.]